MSGIVGYIGDNEALTFLNEGIGKIEYRGYDSVGISVFDGHDILVEKVAGRLDELIEKIKKRNFRGHIGIGHTRWATHGSPSEINSHPHQSNDGKFSIVHNGIIDNYTELKAELIQKGYKFSSETDTEVVAQLMQDNYDGDFLSTVKNVINLIEGTYSLVFMSAYEPDKLICTKKTNSLIVGIGEGENYIASDFPPVLDRTRRTYVISDNEIAIVKKDEIIIENIQGDKIKKEEFVVTWDATAAEKGGFEHFMIKEIHDQPKAIIDTLSGHINKKSDSVVFKELNWNKDVLNGFKKIFIVACGTSYHAGLAGKIYIEDMAKIPVEVTIASEFRYANPIIDDECLMIVVSQSGETIDTLEALKEGKKRGAKVLAITNVVDSSIALEADYVIYTYAGPEIAIASTKAYVTQLMDFLLLAIYFAEIKETLSEKTVKEHLLQIKQLPDKVQSILDNVDAVKSVALEYAKKDYAIFLGRLLDYTVALEGALKLKETSYILAEAYPAGELKHGPIALIEDGAPVITLATQKDTYDKTLNNIIEVKTRQATVTAIAMEDNESIEKHADYVLYIPETSKFCTPVLTVVLLQLLAYYVSVSRGNNVDMPRNLAKSVTVE